MKYIDISAWQGKPDFEKVKNQVDGVILRAGYGRNNVDDQFVRNISECNRLGIPCGVYWFSYAYTPSMALFEALACLNIIKDYRVELPVAFDWEYDSEKVAKNNGVTVTDTLTNSIAHNFCDEIEKAGYYAMLYTNPDMLKRYFNKCDNYDLWLAQYPAKVDLSKPPMKCGIWQYSCTGVIDGIVGNVDLDNSYTDYKQIIAQAHLNNLGMVKKKDCIVEDTNEPATKADINILYRALKENKI